MNEQRAAHVPSAQRFFENPTHYLERNAVIAFRRSLIRDVLGPVRPGRIIDVGCGDGSISTQYLEGGAQLAFVDFSETMLEAARANVPESLSSQVSLHRLDVTSAELSQLDPADVVLCIGVLAHMPDPQATVGRVASLVQPGGRLLLQITDFDRSVGKFMYWLSRASRGRHYRLSRTGSTDIVASAVASGLILASATCYPASMPGYRRLPVRLQTRMLRAMHSRGFLAPLRTELLLLFERPV